MMLVDNLFMCIIGRQRERVLDFSKMMTMMIAAAVVVN